MDLYGLYFHYRQYGFVRFVFSLQAVWFCTVYIFITCSIVLYGLYFHNMQYSFVRFVFSLQAVWFCTVCIFITGSVVLYGLYFDNKQYGSVRFVFSLQAVWFCTVYIFIAGSIVCTVYIFITGSMVRYLPGDGDTWCGSGVDGRCHIRTLLCTSKYPKVKQIIYMLLNSFNW